MAAMHDGGKRALQRMRQLIARIRRHVSGMDREAFLADDRTSDAVLMLLAALGEEVGRVDAAVLEKYPYPWYLVRAMRNVIAHDYFGIRLSSVWATIQQDLAPLDEHIERMLKEEYAS